jgi:cytochrome c-type biogenesis protein
VEYIHSIADSLGPASPVAYGLVLLAGLLIGVTPCNLPLVPLVIGSVAGYGAERKRGLRLVGAFALGAAAAYGVFGAVAALWGAAFQSAVGNRWYVVLAVLCVFSGLVMTGLVRLPLPQSSSGLSSSWSGGLAAAFGLGAVMSLASSACCLGPIFAVLMYSSASGRVFHGAVTLFAFGLGKSLPLLAVGAGVATLRGLAKAATWAHYVEVASGALLILVGFYYLRLGQ